jgi:hypothetical protein
VTYTKQTWVDGVTPLDSENMTPIEEGLFSVSAFFTNVKDKLYGAKGDGVTDDAPAIQAAINAVFAAGGGTVFLPRGTYAIATGLVMKPYVTIRGEGQYVTIIKSKQTGAGAAIGGPNPWLIYGSDVTHGRFMYLTLRGPGVTGLNTGGVRLVHSVVNNVRHIIFSFVRIEEIAGDAVSIIDPILSYFDDVEIVNCSKNGFLMTGGTSFRFRACYVAACAQSGYKLDTVVYAGFDSCASEYNGCNYDLKSSSNITYNGCGCETSWDVSAAYPGTHYRQVGGVGVVYLGCYASQFDAGQVHPNYYIEVIGGYAHIIGFRGNSSVNGPTGGIYHFDSEAIVNFDGPMIFSGPGGPPVGSAPRLEATVGDTTLHALNRLSAGANFASYVLRTNSVDDWAFQTRNDGTRDAFLRDSINAATAWRATQRAPAAGGPMLAVGNVGPAVATLDMQGSIAQRRVNANDADRVVTPTDLVIAYPALTASRVVTLPVATGQVGRTIEVKDESGAASFGRTITVTAQPGAFIESSPNYVLNSPYAFVRLYSNGTNWHVESASQRTNRVAFDPLMPVDVDSGDWNYVQNPAYLYGGYRINNAAGGPLNSFLEWREYMTAGAWSFNVLGAKGPDAGILTLSIDGVDVATFDMYAVAADPLGRVTVSGLFLADNGFRTVRFRSATKNGASTNYFQYLSRILARRTA